MSSPCIASKTSCQFPAAFCRKSRAAGYQGLSSRSSIQRQSGTRLSATQTGRPRAPARWAIDVSQVMTRSRLCMMAAVSRNASAPLSKSSPGTSTMHGRVRPASCSVPSPRCRLINRTDGRLEMPRNRLQRKRAADQSRASLPADADLETVRSEAAPPETGSIAVRRQMRYRSRDIVDVRLEGAWKTGQGQW